MINKAAEHRFFQCFDDSEKGIITNFTKMLTLIQADIFLVMARKAACLIDALIDIGVLTLNGITVSERILDMNSAYLRSFFLEKRVVIIDDTIVSGTTISNTISDLVKYQVKSVNVIILTANKRWYARDLLLAQQRIAKNTSIKLNNPIELSDLNSIRFCCDIVKGLSVLPKPYDFDFPRYNLGRLKQAKAANAFSKDLYWRYYDTTSQLQNENDVFSYTGIPTVDMMQIIDKYCGINVTDVANIKIRFLGVSTNEKNAYNIYAFPMVIFDTIKKSEVNSLYDTFCDMYCIPTDKTFAFSSVTSRLRLIQYYLSMRIMYCWVKIFSKTDETRFMSPSRNINVERMMFSKIGAEILSYVSSDSCDTSIMRISKCNIKEKESSHSLSVTENIQDDFILKTKLIEPFVELYNNVEIPCRDAVKSYDFNNYSEEGFSEYLENCKVDLGRLHKGITFNELAERISYVDSKFEFRVFASVFLDKLITRGIAVPIMQENADFVFRAYRHGEDAIMGDLENQMVTHTLLKICEVAGVDRLSKILTEKIIALFIKFGVKEKWIEELQSDSQTIKDNTIIVTNRHDIHGMRAKIMDKQNIEDSQSMVVGSNTYQNQWYTYYLTKKTYIKPVGNGWGYEFTPPKTFEPEKSKKTFSDLIYFYKTFGNFLKNYTPKMYHEKASIKDISYDEKNLSVPITVDTIDEEAANADTENNQYDSKYIVEFNDSLDWIFTKLASCIAPDDIIDALATEIRIFSENWEAGNSFEFYLALRKSDQDRKSRAKAIIAVNSGQKKYYSYINGEVHNILEKMEKTFSDEIYVATLRNIVDISLYDSRDSRQERLITNLGSWLVTVNFALRILKLLEYCYYNEQQYSDLGIIKSKINDDLFKWCQFDFTTKEQIVGLIDEKIAENEFGRSLIVLLGDMIFYAIRVSKFTTSYNATKELNELFNSLIVLRDINIAETAKKVLSIMQTLLTSVPKLIQNAEYEVKTFGKNTEHRFYNSAIYVEPLDEIKKDFHASLQRAVSKPNNTQSDGGDANNTFPMVLLTKRALLGNNNGFCVLIRDDDSGQKLCNILRSLKSQIYNLNKIILIKKMNQAHCFRVVRQNAEPKFVIHDFPVAELFSALNSLDVIKERCYLEVGSTGCSYLNSSLGLIKDCEDCFSTEDVKNISYQSFSTPMIHKSRISVGIITALEEEFQAMYNLMLDVRKVTISGRGAGHIYYFGYLPSADGKFHGVALTCINGMGNVPAALRAKTLLADIVNVKYVIMVGIAGGVPNPDDSNNHVRLGDVVISDAQGVIQYDNLKIGDDFIELRSLPKNCGSRLLEASVELYRSIEYSGNTEVYNDITVVMPENDILHDVTGNVISHPIDNNRKKGIPRLHKQSRIGAADILLKSAKTREELRDALNIKAIEMESYGIAEATWESEAQYIIVRCVCDYCDKYKNDDWHKYAASGAAAFAKGLLKNLALK